MHISVCIVNVEWNKFDLRNCGDPPRLRSGFEHPTLSLRLRKCVGQSFSTAPLCCRVRCARTQKIQEQIQNTILKYKLYWREHPSSKCGRSWGQIGEVLWKRPNSDGSSQCKSGLFPHRILNSQVPQMYSSSTSTFPYFKHLPKMFEIWRGPFIITILYYFYFIKHPPLQHIYSTSPSKWQKDVWLFV